MKGSKTYIGSRRKGLKVLPRISVRIFPTVVYTTHNHPTLISFIERYFKIEPGALNEGQLKLACIPKTAKLNYASTKRVEAAARKGILLAYPLTSVQNVFIFPGIPFLLQKAFDNIVCDLVDHTDQKSSTKEIYLTASELNIVQSV